VLAREALASSFASRRLPQQHWLAPAGNTVAPKKSHDMRVQEPTLWATVIFQSELTLVGRCTARCYQQENLAIVAWQDKPKTECSTTLT